MLRFKTKMHILDVANMIIHDLKLLKFFIIMYSFYFCSTY